MRAESRSSQSDPENLGHESQEVGCGWVGFDKGEPSLVKARRAQESDREDC